MSFISYAQNFEDVILHRALKDVDKGFYIDVGANDPVSDSVTKAFYDAGWRGINIDPVSEWFEKLELDRPEDINLQVAAGARKGNATFYEVLGTGLSTMDQSVAEKHAKEQGFEIRQGKVPVVRLTSVCEQYARSNIHFLKIDVEGAEKFVLQGLNLKKIRPWIILVESTQPLTQIEKHEEWESILLTSDYEYCYFDGLNRFYAAKEHHGLKDALSIPPNVFDGFIFSGNGSSPIHGQLAHLRELETSLKSTLDASISENNHLKTHTQQLKSTLDAVYHSKSWIITRPLRKLSKFSQKLLYFLIQLVNWLIPLPKRIARWLLVKSIAVILRQPVLRTAIGQWLKKYPRFYNKLRLLALARGLQLQNSKFFQKVMDNIADNTEGKEVFFDTQLLKKAQLNTEPLELDTQNNLLHSEAVGKENIQIQLMRSVRAWQVGKRIDV